MLPADHMGLIVSIVVKYNHFARECPSNFINRSGLIHPAVGDGTPDEAEKRWRRWQNRLLSVGPY